MFGKSGDEEGQPQAKDFSLIGYSYAGQYLMQSIPRVTNLIAHFDACDILRHRIVMFFFERSSEKALR